MWIRRSRTNSSSELTYDSNLVPTVTNTYNLGSGSINWDNLYCRYITAVNSKSHLRPTTNDTYDLGKTDKKWRVTYTNEIQGDALSQIMQSGMLGGLL